MTLQATIESIQQQHEYLLRQNSETGDNNDYISQVNAFLKTLVEAGTYTEDAEQRSLLRALIRYWASVIYNSPEKKFPVVQLRPFDGTQLDTETDKHALSKRNATASPSIDLDTQQEEQHQPGTYNSGLAGTEIVVSTETDPKRTKLQVLTVIVVTLLLIGLFVSSIISFQSSQRQYQNGLNFAATQYAINQQLDADQQQETTLQTYLGQMSALLINPNIHISNQQGVDLRTLARAMTLTVLLRLNGHRKAFVLNFLYDAGLINRQGTKSQNVGPIVNLNSADFSGAQVRGINLGGADLASVNLQGADLNGANLSASYLAGANLSEANLSRANLRLAQLFNQQSNQSPEIVNLTGANLTGADLTGADLTQANLTNADLNGVTLSNTLLTNAIWKNTTCPDGTNSDTNGSNSCVRH